MLNISFHLKELQYRLIYILISVILLFGIIYTNSDEYLLILCPSIPISNYYTNLIDFIILKLIFSLHLTIFSILPWIILTTYLYIRPGLYKQYDIKYYWYIYIIIQPWLLYWIIWYVIIKNLEIYADNYNRFFPLMNDTLKFLDYIWILALLFTLLPLSIYYIITKLYIYIIQNRIYIYYIAISILSLLTPPDLIYFFLIGGILIILMELMILIKLIKDKYLIKFNYYN